MKVLHKTAGTLVLQERPWLVVLLGAIFIAAGITVAMKAGAPAAGAGSALLGAVLILAFGNTVTATFDTTTGRFTRSIRGLLRNAEITHPIQDITGASVESSRTGNRSPGYRVALTLASGVRVPLTTSYSSGKRGKEQAASTIREFLNLQHMPEIRIPDFGDMARLMFDPNASERLGEMFGAPVSEYEAIVRREPDNLEARRQLGLALAMQGKAREAREQLEAARGLAVSRGNPGLAAEIDEMIGRITTS